MNDPDHAALTALFAARCCAICGASANVVCPGSDGVWRDVTIGPAGALRRVRKLVSAEVADISLCLPHAAQRFPWRGERVRPRRATRK